MRRDELREEAEAWREFGDNKVLEGKNSAAEAAYALADNSDQLARAVEFGW